MEILHTILLGPYMYLLKKVMPTLNARQNEVLARKTAFNYSGFDGKVLNHLWDETIRRGHRWHVSSLAATLMPRRNECGLLCQRFVLIMLYMTLKVSFFLASYVTIMI